MEKETYVGATAAVEIVRLKQAITIISFHLQEFDFVSMVVTKQYQSTSLYS